MDPRTVQFAAEASGGRLLDIRGDAVFTGVTIDSRAVRPGDLFVALRGENADGHTFLEDSLARGAAAVVVEPGVAGAAGKPRLEVENPRAALGKIAAAYRTAFDLPTVAIAGSNGKTTTKELCAAVLRQKLRTLWSEASFNNDLGIPLTLLRLEMDHQAGVFEAGTNHPGELAPLLRMIRPRYGVITSIGREHLEYFRDLAGVIDEEGSLGEVLPADGTLFVNGDTPGVAELSARTEARVVTCGVRPQNAWRILRGRMDVSGTTFELEAPDPEYSGTYHTHLLGMHQTVNASFAVCLGKELGLGRAEIQRGLDSCQAAKMRLQLRRIDDFILIDDSYNANADSMHAALDTLARFPCAGRRLAVLGDMGELGHHAAEAHEEVGVIAAAKNVDCLFTIGERSLGTAAAAKAAGLAEVESFPEIAPAVLRLRGAVRPKDVVLVKASRSSRLERVVAELEQHFGAPARLG